MQKNQIRFFPSAFFPSQWSGEVMAGALVFMLAMPLCLGIAKASGFPPAMGVLTAMVGGFVSLFFRVSPLAIKGPAAGLITLCASSVQAFGGGEHGWEVTSAIILVMAIFQMLLGLLRLGSMSDFFPQAAVHGMLAAIGLIIIAKQIPVLLGDEPSLYAGESPLELYLHLPKWIASAHWRIALIGLSGLALMFLLPKVKWGWVKKIPAPMWVLLLTVPLALGLHFQEEEPAYSLVQIGPFWDTLAWRPDFSEWSNGIFWKYVLMFLFVSSLESLLTVKALDNLDPLKRTSTYNGELIGQGAGNLLSGLLGGLPMISEVVRSTANVRFGGRTRWSNFFHALFLTLAMMFLVPWISMIPNAALAAMLIYAGYNLAAPQQFKHIKEIGLDQLVIFLVTIGVTLWEDLLLGILAGIVLKVVFHLYRGARWNELFRSQVKITDNEQGVTLVFLGSALFTNMIDFKKRAGHQLASAETLVIDFSQMRMIDHSFLLYLDHFSRKKREKGQLVHWVGLEKMRAESRHPLASRRI